MEMVSHFFFSIFNFTFSKLFYSFAHHCGGDDVAAAAVAPVSCCGSCSSPQMVGNVLNGWTSWLHFDDDDGKLSRGKLKY